MYSFFNSWIATPLMALEFLAFGMIFSNRFKKQPYFWLRFIPMALMEIAAVFLVEFFFSITTGTAYHYGQVSQWDYRESLFRFLFFLSVMAATFLVLKFSYAEKAGAVFLVCATSFAFQHLFYNLSSIVGLFGNMIEGEFASGLFHLLSREFFLAAGFVIAFLLARRFKERPNPYEGNSRKKILISAVVVFVCIGIYRINSDMPGKTVAVDIGFGLYAIVSCLLLLMLVFGLLESDRTHAEAEAYRELLHQQRAQYELSKQNIELISIKCHDLKHQVRALKTKENEAAIKEIEHEIMIYDSSIKTGNEVLDVILREKLLQAESEEITLTCLLEGSAISFMEEMDIYSLFGNILSNAFESVRKCEDKEKRAVSLTGRKVGNMFFLQEENYVEGKVEFENGLPKTDKKDGDLHGFGMKSMHNIALKYKGEMVVKTQNGKFSIVFIFPLPANI